MESSINPFTPSFGKVPPILAGRKILIGEFEQAFSLNPNDPNLCSLFSGPRGVGKTVLIHVERGAELARRDFVNGIIKKTLQDLSDGDIAFLEAMLPDKGHPSLMNDIAERMGKTPNYARVYRTRLVEQGLISAPRRGFVEFEMPLLREYLMEN